MATSLDLQEQEQLDALKAFWKQYGNLVTWTLVVVLAAFAGWNGWQAWQRNQAENAGAMFDELERAAQAGDADRAARVFNDLRSRFPHTAFAQQGGLATAKVQLARKQIDAAKASLTWVAESGAEDEMRTVARLRLAAMQLDASQFDDALKTLDQAKAPDFAALVADRRGDVLMAQGKREEARTAYQSAWQGLSEKVDYRRLVEAKLTAIGASPGPDRGQVELPAAAAATVVSASGSVGASTPASAVPVAAPTAASASALGASR